MANNDTKNVAKDPLDEIKEVEALIRTRVLIKCLANLKYTARKIKRYKALITAELKEVNMSDEDVKRVIDWINESPDVKLTEDDLRKVGEDAREYIKSLRKEAEAAMASGGNTSVGNQGIYNNFFTGTTMPLSNPQWTVTSATTNDSVQVTDSNGKSLNLKV